MHTKPVIGQDGLAALRVERNQALHSEAIDFQSVIDGMSEGFTLLDFDFTIIEVNAETLRLDTRDRNELIGRSHWDTYPGTEHSELGERYKTAMRDRTAVTLEHRHTWDDGRVSWLDMRAYPVSEQRLAIFFRDVTDRYEALRASRESEQRFRAAVEAFTDALWTNDAQGRMTGEQLGWAALTGQTYDAYQGYGWSTAVHPDDAQPTIAAWEQAVTERRPFVFEHRVKTRDGTWRRFAVRAIPVFEDDGTIREWVGVHRDITEATEARLQLARNAETFQTLVTSNPFGIYIVDSDFRVRHVSEGCRKVFAGVTPLLGRDFADIMSEIWQEAFATEAVERFRHTLATGEPYVSHRTVENRRNVEAIEAYDWRIDRVILPDGSFGVVCYFYDLSERVALETSLRQALADKDMLVREIDHRVRNSLTLVSALLSMQSNASHAKDVKHALSVASTRMQAVARIHERLYKSEELGIIVLGDYLAQICDDLQASLGDGGARVELDAIPVQMAVDHAVPLGLITNELVTNAFKHCGRGAVLIKVSLTRQDGIYALVISDNGTGMPDTFAPANGDGLGMKVVELLTRQVGGSIDLPSPGSRAAFRIDIPSDIIVTPVTV